ncbi:MAG: hypothetical protein V9E96_00575 [Chitinophagaceae bacterium]|jgi:hypothetical protein
MNKNEIIKRKPKVPNLEKVRFEIDKIINSGFEDFKIDDIGDLDAYHNKLSKLFLEKIGLLFYNFIPTSSVQLKSKIYRVRRYKSGMNLGLISEYSYCPVPLCTGFYRANYPNNPVFYSSPDAKTALVEVFQGEFDKEEGELFLISEWSFREGENLNITPFVFSDRFDDQFVSGFQKRMIKKVIDTFHELNEEEINSIKEILVFFSNLFLYEDTYKITSFLAHSHIYSDSGYQSDVFMYPSVQTKYSTLNYAINPNTVDQKMRLEKVYAVRVNKFLKEGDLATVNFGFEKVGINNDCKIDWKDFDDQSISDFKKIFPSLDE